MEGEIIEDLSSSHTKNRVYLFRSGRHGDIIKKEFADGIHFKRALEALKIVGRTLHPAIYKIDMRRRHLYMSHDPVRNIPESWDACVSELMKTLHTSTKRYNGVSDPGTGEAFSTWKDFLRKRGRDAVETLSTVKNFRGVFESWMEKVEDSPFAPVSYIHCDIRRENIGERNGRYILLDYEHAKIGDPYWDVARYVLESAESKPAFYEMYGVKNPEKADVFIKLMALDDAAYFIRHGQTDNTEYKNCLEVLNGE